MNPLSWIEPAFAAEQLQIAPEFKSMIDKGERKQRPFYFLDAKDALEQTKDMHRQFPSHRVIAFARRGDYDGVVCLVLADEVYPRGHVLVLHDDAWAGTEIDDDFPSLAA